MKYLVIIVMILVGLALLPDLNHEVIAIEVIRKPEVQPVEVVEPVVAVHLQGCELVNKYDWDTTIAKAVCLAESGNNPNAVGDLSVIGGIYAPSYGLMQIRALVGRPDKEQLLNPEFNMQYAYELWSRQGFKPWSAFNNNKYKKYLGE